MNQILSTDIEKKKKNNKASINTIVIFFCIFLIIFGLSTTVIGAYSYYKNIINKSNEQLLVSNSTKPFVTSTRENSNTINIIVTHDKAISSITYTINEEDEKEIDVNNRTNINENITLSAGINHVTVTAKDISGVTTIYETTVDVAEGPSITLTPVEGKVQATTESTTNIDKIKYYWDEDEANATVLTINATKNDTLIDVSLEGTHTLNIIATDIEGRETKKTQKVMGVNKPQIKITTDGKNFFIKAEDSQGLSKVEITLNTNETITENIEGNEYSKNIELQNGENRLTVKVFNKNDVSQTSRVKYTKE